MHRTTITQARELLKLQLFLNGLNMVLDILAAGVLGLGAVGIAGGTVVAEVITCGLGFYRLKRFLVENHAVAPEWRMFSEGIPALSSTVVTHSSNSAPVNSSISPSE